MTEVFFLAYMICKNNIHLLFGVTKHSFLKYIIHLLKFMKFILLIHIFVLCTFATIHSQTNTTFTTTQDSVITYPFEEVIITGTRTSKKIIDIPYSVTRIENYEYKFDKKIAISDVLSNIPGVFMQSRYGNHDVRISIRGFGSRSNSGIRGVRILLDGIPESEPDGQTRIEAIDFNSIGRIEVVKGNSSSLYTNAPGGVINFINDVYFQNSFAEIFSEVASFSLKRNGLKFGIVSDETRFLFSLTNHQYGGFRKHSNDKWKIVNSVFEITPNTLSKFQLLLYYVDGTIRLPGSLNISEYENAPMEAAQNEVDYDYLRLSKKGRIGVRWNQFLDKEKNDELEITGYSTMKYFERKDKKYRIFNRYGVGASARYIRKNIFWERQNEFSIGGDVFYQTGPIEFYKNIGGKKNDVLEDLFNETIANSGFYVQHSFDVVKNSLSLMISGRYDKVMFEANNQTLSSQNDSRRFEKFTPKAALNFKITPFVALYTSYGMSFDSPASNELDNHSLSSNQGGTLLNPDLKPQKSLNYELGIKGSFLNVNSHWAKNILYEITLFHSVITDEIVPFEINTEVFFRNSAQTKRIGIETGSELNIIENLNVKFAYTFSKFYYEKYATNIFIHDTIITKMYSNNFVPSVPKHNLFIECSYKKQYSENISGVVKAQNTSISSMFMDDANSLETNSYNVFSTTAGIEIQMAKFTLLLTESINNIFNKKYVGFININSTNKRFFEVGEPRNFYTGLKLSYLF
ncbi:MAG: TonB-dependent receptor [Ignavibacteria bacterium]|nr:TonB-dependent receptor [Ignavibacteria bacterium]